MSYYMGDPSFLGALFGAVKGYVSGGYVGAVQGAIQGSHGHGTSAAAGAAETGGVYGPTRLGQAAGYTGYAAGRAVRAVGQHPYLSAAGASAAGGLVLAHHRGRGGAVAVHPVTGQVMRRRRRMNVCNPRALRRAIRRARGFEKLALKSIRLVSPHRLKHRHFGGFKKSRRK